MAIIVSYSHSSVEFQTIRREEGIRTLDTLPYTHFPGVLLQPLGHLSVFLKDCKNSFSTLATEYFLGIGGGNGGYLFCRHFFYLGQFV